MVKTFDSSLDAGLNLPVGHETPEQQVALLEAMVAGMHQDMLEKDRKIDSLQTELAEHRSDGTGNAALLDLKASNDDKDKQIAQLESALASTEETLFQRACDAEDRGRYLQAVVNEKEQKIAQLQATLEALNQAAPTIDIQSQEAGEAAERNLMRAVEAEERLMQLASMVDEKNQVVSRLEAEVVLLKKAAAVGGDANAQSQGSADNEARVQHLQVLVDAKDRQITQLEHLLQGMQEEASMRRPASLSQDSVSHLQVMLEQTEAEVQRLNEELNQLKKRAEIAEAGRQDLRKELASSTEEVVRLQVALDGRDVHMAQMVEDEKRTAGAHRQVIEAEVSRLQTFIAEKDRLIEQLMAAVAPTDAGHSGTQPAAEVAQLTTSREQEVAHLSQSFEEERAALRDQMTLNFEKEYGALRGQVKQLRREAEAALAERDATAQELRQVVAQYEQRLLLSEAASERGSMEAGRSMPVLLQWSAHKQQLHPSHQPVPEGPPIWQPQEAQAPPMWPNVVWREPRRSAPAMTERASLPQQHGGLQCATSPPAAQRAASPMAAQRVASPAPVHRAASPIMSHRAASPIAMHRAASPLATQRVASPMARQRAASPMARQPMAAPTPGPRAAWGEVPRQLTAPPSSRSFMPGSMDDAFPFGAVPGGMGDALLVPLAGPAVPVSLAATAPAPASLAALPRSSGGSAAPPSPAVGALAQTPAGGSMSLPPQGGSMSFSQAQAPLSVAASPPRPWPSVAGSAQGSVVAPPQQAASPVVSPVRMRPGDNPPVAQALDAEVPVPKHPSVPFLPGVASGAQGPARVVPPSPLVDDPRVIVRGFPPDLVRQEAASQLPMHPGVPSWAMQQPIQPLADNKRNYLLPAADEAGAPHVAGGYSARTGLDSYEAAAMQEQGRQPPLVHGTSRGSLQVMP